MTEPAATTDGALVLGSSSRYRAELLGRLGVPFTQEAPRVDERAFDGRFAHMAPEDFALLLARAKAEALARPGGRRWLLCADQVGSVELMSGERRQLVKPGTEERCVEQLMLLAGRSHVLVNGIVLLNEGSGQRLEAVDRHVLTMGAFGRAEAQRYAAEYRPFDCAGGYRIEDDRLGLFESVRSEDDTGIIGLPLVATARLLEAAGFQPVFKNPADSSAK